MVVYTMVSYLLNLTLGEFKEDSANGYGCMKHKTEGFTEGEWESDAVTGVGVECWLSDNHLYFGEFDGGKKNGVGLYFWDDGSKYEGEFTNGSIEGWVL